VVTTVIQNSPRGTGDAARVGLEALGSASRVLILYGDTPLLDPADPRKLLGALDASTLLAMLSCDLDDPRGYGRVMRDGDGRVLEVREDRDLDETARTREREVNAGVHAVGADTLRDGLQTLRPDNA